MDRQTVHILVFFSFIFWGENLILYLNKTYIFLDNQVFSAKIQTNKLHYVNFVSINIIHSDHKSSEYQNIVLISDYIYAIHHKLLAYPNLNSLNKVSNLNLNVGH